MQIRSAAKWLVLMSTIQTVPLPAQSSDASAGAAGFKLSLSYYRDHSTFVQSMITLNVTLRNMSKETIYESPCAAFGRLYKVSVVYKGVPLAETEYARTRREAMEEGEANGGICFGSYPGRSAAPGESLVSIIHWNADKEGAYQFTVERKTFPKDPKQGVTVKSNTVTVIVPDPEAKKSE